MPFQVRIVSSLARHISSWQLPDSVLVEVYLRLRDDLIRDPAHSLQRTQQLFDGMNYSFSLMDPENRLQEHFFTFQVLYGSDEETLYVVRGAYIRTSGI